METSPVDLPSLFNESHELVSTIATFTRNQVINTTSSAYILDVNTSTKYNNTNLSSIPGLEEIEFLHFLDIGLPAFTSMMILSIIGSFGNIHTFLVYTFISERKKLHVRLLIMWLSAVDLLVYAVVMPYEMQTERFRYTTSSEGACKILRFVAHATAIASGSLLALIARERYQKVYSIQLIQNLRLPNSILAQWMRSKSNDFQHNFQCGLLVFISLLISIPILVFIGMEPYPSGFPDRVGWTCTAPDHIRSTTIAMLYAGIGGVIGLILFCICSYCYVKILYLIYKQAQEDRKRKNMINLKPVSHETNKDDKEGNKNVKPTSRFTEGRQITISLIVATSVSFTGYILFITAEAIRIGNPELEKQIEDVTAVLIRACFINNTGNPVAYFLFDRKFRKACKKLYMKIVEKICNKTG